MARGPFVTVRERQEIGRLTAAGERAGEVAAAIGRSRGSVYRVLPRQAESCADRSRARACGCR